MPPEVDIQEPDENGIPITFHVLVVEGMETSDGRYIEPGALTHRSLPLPVLAQTMNPVGGGGHDGAEVIGRLDTLERVEGPSVISRETGEPFPEGSFVWRGEGYVDPEAVGTKLALKRYLTGNSADLTEVEVEFQYENSDGEEEDMPSAVVEPTRTSVTKGRIAATTLVPIPAFADAYVTLGGQLIEPADDMPEDIVASALWRSEEIGDACSLCAAGVAKEVTPVSELPLADWFLNPKFTEPTPGRVQEIDGHHVVSGHLATWGTCHIGFAGKCVTPPRSRSGYSYFTTGTRAAFDQVAIVDVAVGQLTLGTGHAPLSAGSLAAAEHYDNTGTAVADVAVGEDEHGIWYAGVLRKDISEADLIKFKAAGLSGDWRAIHGNLELVAALAVNVPGFPIPRPAARVASGSPVALVAAGVMSPPRASGAVVLDYGTLADAIAERMHEYQKAEATRLARRASLLEEMGVSEPLGNLPALRRDLLLVELGGMTEEEFAKKNWVSKAGGLPSYIKRIAKHLQDDGMDESRAIATAVNAAKKMCSTGDTNFPGKQEVNPGSRAEACAAVADWERKKAQ